MSYRDTAWEVNCVLSWSEEARAAYVKAHESWCRAGRPSHPLGATNWRYKYWRRRRPQDALRGAGGPV